MLKIEAQSVAASLRYRSSGEDAINNRDDGDFHSSTLPPNHHHHHRQPLHPSDVLVTVFHSPLHVGCFFQAPPFTNSSTGSSYSGAVEVAAAGDGCHCSAFTLASPVCAKVFPLRRCDLEGGGGGGAGAALFAAAAVGGSKGRGDGLDGGLLSAEDVPKEERLRYRYVVWLGNGGGGEGGLYSWKRMPQ